jgi:hypothetical protein
MSSAIRRSAQDPSEATCSDATPATGAVGISRLEAEEDVNAASYFFLSHVSFPARRGIKQKDQKGRGRG